MPQGYFSQPYSAGELFWLLFHNAFGPSRRGRGRTGFLPPDSVLNPCAPALRLAFPGDLLPFPGRRLVLDEETRRLLDRADYLVANFEGTILTAKEPRVLMGQVHSPAIIEFLSAIHPPARTLLNCANNHSGDFGRERFERSCGILREAGFRIFGTREAPSVDLPPGIRIAGATRWSNRPCDYVAAFRDRLPRPGAPAHFNVLSPHWGFEMRLYPEPRQIRAAQAALEDWDLIAGHHSHCPQPVSAISLAGARKLVAYSLGDLLYRYPVRKYLDGILLLAEIGPGPDGGWVVGEVSWRFTSLELRAGEATLRASTRSRYFA